ncbi:MAG TPA: hypothetical protein VK524_14770 [Polyangiaceae bacterium]|nr:hypothetical protein [Polyangiaceae bacterium]
MKRFALGLIAVSAFALHSASVFAENKPAPAPSVRAPVKGPIAVILRKVTCQTAGTPTEFPNGMRIFNKGNSVLAAGTKISWKFTNGGGGTHTLAAALAPSASVFHPQANPGGIGAGAPCTAKIL